MDKIGVIFQRIEKLINKDSAPELLSLILKHEKAASSAVETNESAYPLLKPFLEGIIQEIDELSNEIINNDSILISVKNQKLLRTCFQLIVSFGVSKCLIPGLGISLANRCISTKVLQNMNLTDEQKYEILVLCTDFFTRSYNVPVLKNILITIHLSDYLACLIQLSFAPLKKVGVYDNFTMTEEMYEKLNEDKKKYTQIYEHLVNNCFQPMLMKELLVLQNVTDRTSPNFVKRVIAKELSRRLVAPGGLLSLIRCFLETYSADTGHDWKKIEMISKIITTKHGNTNEDDYLTNISSQLKQILTLNNMQYLTTAITCILSLSEKYPQSESVNNVLTNITQSLDYNVLLSKCDMPGTIMLTPQEIERKVNILHCAMNIVKLEWNITMLAPNLYILYLLAIKCTKVEMKTKLQEIVLKCLELLKQDEMVPIVKTFLYGEKTSSMTICVEEYESGLTIKCMLVDDHDKQKSIQDFLELFNAASNNNVVQKLFECCLSIFIEFNVANKQHTSEKLLTMEDEMQAITDNGKKHSHILQVLTEISTSTNGIIALKTNPMMVINFVENLLIMNVCDANEEYITIALVLLNTILSNIKKTPEVQMKLHNLIPHLRKMSENVENYNSIICREILSFISSEYPDQLESAYSRALSDVFDNLLPVRAHGIIELTKLIDNGDPETISKRHYIFCLLQEQLKDSDSYIYLSVINGIASLATHCTEDVLSVLCREFLQVSKKQDDVQTNNMEASITEVRMKVGDIIVKVTKRLGEMAVVHKTILLNTMLCASRDSDPFIRTSALSNLAEIALVIHYQMGTIIYEVLLCIWGIIETDKAVECRRAAVLVIASLLKGMSKDTLIELKENLLPLYRTLMKLYKDEHEDSVVRLHSQIALEEINDTVNQFLLSGLTMENKRFVLSQTQEIVYK